ncbi:MAG: LytR C-terminal domain-containing protein [Nitrososphaeria archaeon]
MGKERKEKIAYRKVPYKERRTIKKYLVPRTVQLKKRRWLERAAMLASFLIFILTVYLLSNLSIKLNSYPAVTQRTVSQQVKLNKSVISLKDSPFFIYSEKEKRLYKTAICAYDERSETLSVILIEESFYVPVFGLGVVDAQSITTYFLNEYFSSIKNAFNFPLKGPFKVSPQYLEPSVIQQSPNSLIADLIKLNKLPSVNKLKIKSAEVVPAPTRLSKIGKRTVVVVDTSRLNEAANIMFSDNFKKKQVKGTAIVLNGSGLPAAGARAAYLLVESGFYVKAVRNAEKFDYLITEIRSSDKEKASIAQRALGCGEVKIAESKIEVADVVTIIGKDFSSRR